MAAPSEMHLRTKGLFESPTYDIVVLSTTIVFSNWPFAVKMRPLVKTSGGLCIGRNWKTNEDLETKKSDMVVICGDIIQETRCKSVQYIVLSGEAFRAGDPDPADSDCPTVRQSLFRRTAQNICSCRDHFFQLHSVADQNYSSELLFEEHTGRVTGGLLCESIQAGSWSYIRRHRPRPSSS